MNNYPIIVHSYDSTRMRILQEAIMGIGLALPVCTPLMKTDSGIEKIFLSTGVANRINRYGGLYIKHKEHVSMLKNERKGNGRVAFEPNKDIDTFEFTSKEALLPQIEALMAKIGWYKRIPHTAKVKALWLDNPTLARQMDAELNILTELLTDHMDKPTGCSWILMHIQTKRAVSRAFNWKVETNGNVVIGDVSIPKYSISRSLADIYSLINPDVVFATVVKDGTYRIHNLKTKIDIPDNYTAHHVNGAIAKILYVSERIPKVTEGVK